MAREADLLIQLVERPFDRGVRLVYADWLLEQGDPRGEVIALCARDELALTERRRVARLTAQHGRAWLGPLVELSDPHRTRFVGGFLDELVCNGARPDALWLGLMGDARLCTVRTLALPPSKNPAPLAVFLSSPVMKQLSRLELGSDDWQALGVVSGLKLDKAVVASWGVFHRELAPLGAVPLFTQAPAVGLSSTEFINPLVVREIVQQVRAQHLSLAGFSEVQLVCRYGVLEGAAAWLLSAEHATEGALPLAQRWSVEVGEVAFTRLREGDGAFRELQIDLSLPESGTGEKEAADSMSSFERRLATAAGVLVQLAPARLRAVRVKLVPGARLRHKERDALRAAARRSGLLESFVVDGEPVSP